MKNVGIITIHDIYNYGSILQAYATLRAVDKLGFRAEIIDYKYPNIFHSSEISSLKKVKSMALKMGNSFLKDMLPGRKYQTYKKNYKNFTDKHFHLSEKRYPTVQSLMDDPPEYDIFLAGSDQIWRPKFVKADPCFFLGFAKDKKKISYASSFGCTSIPAIYQEKYARYLNSFDAIGVREKPGVDIVKNLTGKDARLVLDPTLLLDRGEWATVMKPHQSNRPYILCYGNTTEDKYMEKLALHVKKHTGYDVIRVNGKFYDYFNQDMTYILDAGPAEWLGLFANASLVLAQSFHATAFAINFERPVIPLLRGDANHDSRQLQLLEMLDLKHKAVTIGDEFPEINEQILDANYAVPAEILKAEREKSIGFLKTSLESYYL